MNRVIIKIRSTAESAAYKFGVRADSAWGRAKLNKRIVELRSAMAEGRKSLALTYYEMWKAEKVDFDAIDGICQGILDKEDQINGIKLEIRELARRERAKIENWKAAEERRMAFEAAEEEERRMALEAAGMKERRLDHEAAGMKERRLDHEAEGTEERRLDHEAAGMKERRLDHEAEGTKERHLDYEAEGTEERPSAVEMGGAGATNADEAGVEPECGVLPS